MAEIRGLVMRIQAVDGGFVQVMNQVGAAGLRALAQLDEGQRRSNRSNRQLNDGISRVIHTMRGYAATIAVLDGPLGGFASRVNAVATVLSSFQGRMVLAGVSMAAFTIGLGAAVLAFGKAVGAAAQFERQMDRLDAQIRLTHGRYIGTAEELNAVARQLGEDTLASAAEARDAISVALSFEGVSTENLERILQLAQDMTEAFGGDLRTNVGIIAKAIVAPASSMDELRRRGVLFTVAQREMIDNFVRMGEEAQAAEIILERIAATYGGLGAASAQNFLGQLDTIGELLLQVSENVGGVGDRLLSWLLNITQVVEALRIVKELTDRQTLVEQSEAEVGRLTAQVNILRENLRTTVGTSSSELAGELAQSLEKQIQLRERELAAAREILEIRRAGAAAAETDAQIQQVLEGRRTQQLKLENQIADAQSLVTKEVERLGLEVELIGLPESEVAFRQFLEENFEGVSTKIMAEVDTGPALEAFRRLQAAQEAFAQEQERIARLEKEGPVPRLAPESARAGFAAGVGAITPVLKPDVEIREEFAAIRQEVDPLGVSLERLRTQLAVLSEAESVGIDVGQIGQILEREEALTQLEVRAQQVTLQFREHFGQAADEAAGFVEAGAQRMTQALGDFVVGQQSAGDAFRDLWAGIFEDLSRRALSFALTTALTAGAQQAGSGLLGTVLAGLASGAAAEGGPRGGRAVLVGDRGPEVVQMHGSGWVYPHHSPITRRALQYMGRAAFGGEMTVGGEGGPDSQLVAVRATPGERISVSQPQRGFLDANVNIKGMGESPADYVLAQQVAAILFPELERMTRAQVLDMNERHRVLAGVR